MKKISIKNILIPALVLTLGGIGFTLLAQSVGPSISIDTINGQSGPFDFNCLTNPLFNPVIITGSGTGEAPPGLRDQYAVQIDWGDGTVINDLGIFNPSTHDHGPFDFIFEGSHSYGVGEYIITARLYHSEPPGQDNQADTVISVPICVIEESECVADGDCDDGNVCNGTETCEENTCQPGTPLVCDDQNLCTDNGCNPELGCMYENNTDPCDDGDACTIEDVCAQGMCLGGPSMECDDDDICTNDTCNSVSGCIFTPNTLCVGPECSEQSINWNQLDNVDIGELISELFHPIAGWSDANIPGGYGGCQNGVVCDYRQVIEDPCTEEERSATTILHTGSNIVDRLEIRHLDGISLLDSYNVYINEQFIDSWDDVTQVSSEIWRETEFDVSIYGFTGDLEIRLEATDTIWPQCATYGQVAIDWVSVYGCGEPWEEPYCGDGNIDPGETCEADIDCDDQDERTIDACNTCQCEHRVIEQPVCGNSVVEGDEECDDGTSGSSTCSVECTVIETPDPYCGDGDINSELEEECDNGELNGQACSPGCESTCNYCTNDCTLAELTGGSCGGGGGGGGGVTRYCGDGLLTTSRGEECDDGNKVDGDGCSSTCQTEEIEGEVLGEAIETEVLGADTTLPETGQDPFWFIIGGLFILLLAGVNIKELANN